MTAGELTEKLEAYIQTHMEESEKSGLRMEEYIKHSDLNAGGIITPGRFRYRKSMTGRPLTIFQRL